MKAYLQSEIFYYVKRMRRFVEEAVYELEWRWKVWKVKFK